MKFISKNKLLLSMIISLALTSYNINSNVIEANDDSVSTEIYQIGESKNCGDDDGFTNPSTIKKNDNHFGWDLGHFLLSGYTRIENRESDNPIFLKNVGDKVKLSFKLDQDINQLNGNEKLKINDDKKAYDEFFGIKETSFGQGALIIRHTDYMNVAGEPQIYTDYLKGIEVGAETEVQLCEEGDYEVSLDYSLRSETFSDVLGIKTSSIAAFEDDYKISFTFSVRNGNCMVYPFDVKSGKELTDTAFTENGFRLDLAKSRYLKIDIIKQVLNSGKDGLTEDTRFNKPAKDGEEFTDDGIYIITVTNPYTERTIEKKIYIGSDPVLQAYVTNQNYSIAEINNLVSNGAIIEANGSISIPEITEPVMEAEIYENEKSEAEENTVENYIDKDTVQAIGSEIKNKINKKNDDKKESNKANNKVKPIIVCGVIVILILLVLISKKKIRRY